MTTHSRIDEVAAEQYVADQVFKLREALVAISSKEFVGRMVAVADDVTSSLRRGGKVLFCGNGGSAADAQHLAAELVGRQNFDRVAAAGIALTVDTSALTAIANDYGFDTIFSRQVEALGRPGDILFGISTSGRSRNIIAAFETARGRGIHTVALTGANPRELGAADHVLAVPATETAKIQECHIFCGHAILAIAERALFVER